MKAYNNKCTLCT